jgi:iduronate 2-sulfatase
VRQIFFVVTRPGGFRDEPKDVWLFLWRGVCAKIPAMNKSKTSQWQFPGRGAGTRFLIQLCAVTALAATGAAAPKPNVLFIMADDLRAEVATYGSSALTPNLNRLARRAVQFDHAYAQQAVCNPSRSSMLTGRRPDTLGLWCNSVHFRELQTNVTTLPLWFKDHGYTTRCVGKIFHNWHTKEKGDARSWSAPEFLHYANHSDDKPQVQGELPPNLATVPKAECRDVPDEAYYDGRVAAEAVHVLDEIKGLPFFLAVGFWKPHAPFNAPKKYWDLYDRAKLPPLDPRRPEGAPDIAFHDSRELLGAPPNQLKLTPEQAAEWRHGYFANIAYMDAQLGKVLDELEHSGVADRTIITFVGDHGYHIGEHSLWGKTSNFELDARVPLYVAVPGSKNAGRRTEALVEMLDLFPTLAELCRLPRPLGLEGLSLGPVLRDPLKSVKPAAFTQHPRPAYYDREPSKTPLVMGYSVRTPQVRYTEWRDWKKGGVVARELYDAKTDPAEMHNALDDLRLITPQRIATDLLRKQFFPIKHSTSPPPPTNSLR